MIAMTPWYRCRAKFLVALLAIGAAIGAVCKLMQIRTFHDAYLSGSMLFNGPPIWRGIAIRTLSAGDPISAVTNQYPPTHFSALGHFTIYCYHQNSHDVSLISKDGSAVYASVDYFDHSKVYFESMTAEDNAGLEKEKTEYHISMTQKSQDSANKVPEDTARKLADPQH
jgi:hypothetical protein